MTMQITINGRLMPVESGQTILQVARENGVDIPTLCDYPGLKSHGSCRMCIVEVEGREITPSACTTLAENGMIIHTHSPKVSALRVELFKLLLSEHPSACLFCEERSHCDDCMVTLRKTGVTTGCRSCAADGQCDLQTFAQRLQLMEGGYPYRYRMLPVEKKDPFFDRDYNLCILCERCVRVCEENHFSSAITLISRGTDTVVGTPFGQRLLQAGCSFCGACVEVCTTGALSERVRKWSGVPGQEVSTTCPLCSAGCQMRLLVKNGMVIGSLPDRANGTNELCVKGRFGIPEMVNHSTRLQQPMVMDHEGKLPVKWEKAVDAAAGRISTCDPEKYGLILSADCSNETLYVARKFAREVAHSDAIYLSSAAEFGRGWQTLQRLYGKSKPLSRLSSADAVLCLGFDGKYAQSVVETKLSQARRSGTRLITFDTPNYSLRKYADEWLQPALGEEKELLEMFIEILHEKTATPQLWPMPPQAQRSAKILMEAKRPVVLVGSAFLTHPESATLLKLLEKLIAQIPAELIFVPDRANLGGAFRLGITNPVPAQTLQNLDVVHLIGETLPAGLSSQAFVLYQNICPPESIPDSGVLLPAAAFSEEEGTFIDQVGELRRMNKAVQAPGSALPSWQILCLIARKLGVPGFDYETEAQIRAEMESTAITPVDQDASLENLFQLEAAVFPANRSDDHAYMGFPLRTWVAGFRTLYPEPTLKIK